MSVTRKDFEFELQLGVLNTKLRLLEQEKQIIEKNIEKGTRDQALEKVYMERYKGLALEFMYFYVRFDILEEELKLGQ